VLGKYASARYFPGSVGAVIQVRDLIRYHNLSVPHGYRRHILDIATLHTLCSTHRYD